MLIAIKSRLQRETVNK